MSDWFLKGFNFACGVLAFILVISLLKIILPDMLINLGNFVEATNAWWFSFAGDFAIGTPLVLIYNPFSLAALTILNILILIKDRESRRYRLQSI